MSGAPDDVDTPLRPQASPRSSPTHSARSSFSFGGSSEDLAPQTESSEAQSPTRGRSLARNPPQRTHNRRLTTIHQDRPRTIDWDSAFTQNRLMSRDLTAEPQGMFDMIKEPLPFGVERYRSSLSEELYKAATWNTSIDVSRFGDHRDTFALFGLRHLQSRRIGLPDIFFEQLLRYIDFDTYLSIRLSCRCWSEAISRVRRIATPSVCHLPFEILEKIYVHLDPIDFNSARRACRAWMITSLDEGLLTLMLKRGGWWRAAKADVDLQEQSERDRIAASVNEEWILSKRLATECSLRPDWTGNGLLSDLAPSISGQSTSLIITSTTDFSELSNGCNPTGGCQHAPVLHFTVSVCNKYLLITEGCLIYVYPIQDPTSNSHDSVNYLSSLTTVVCPHRVLAVSMDTSSQRFAIAALMEERMGIVCDISDHTTDSREHSAPRALPTAMRDSRGQMYSPRSSGDHVLMEATNPHEYTTFQIANDRAMARAIAEATLPEIYGARTTRQSWTMNDPFLSPIDAPGSSQDYEVPCPHRPVATGPRSIYRNLCSAEDPPRSVAICPQRRCVAFGCAAGIELHWIDALTGQDLNRWFPLTAPSDFLYFLPPRPGVDSAKKLRLISSASHPKEKEAMRGRFFPSGGDDAAGYQSMRWDEEFQGVGLRGSAWRGSGWCDHYQAVPVSDGWNILFTDPEEGVLYLGSDAPPGARANKLSRRFAFRGPSDADGNATVPRVYASARELRWGVRIVVGYGEALWFFVVPPDVYFLGQESSEKGVHEPNSADTAMPTKIEGIEIGKVPFLIDVAIDASGGDVTIWAFAADGMAYTWQIGAGSRPKQQRIVGRDGTVMPAQDADGDTFMHNMPTQAVHFDGNTSHLPQATGYDPLDDRIVDKDGDVIMRDAAGQDEGYESEFEAAGGSFAIHAPPLWGRWSNDDADWVPDYLQRRGSGIEDEGVGIDVLEMSRLEVEVLGS